MEDLQNWESYLNNYFQSVNPIIKKTEYKEGFSLTYEKENIYVYCDIDFTKEKIKKIEFGRYVNGLRENQIEANWVKGVFINCDLKFFQTSLFGENGEEYEASYNNNSMKLMAEFLKTPFINGWTEYEYWLGESCYKIIVKADNVENSITIMDIGEQDIPMLPDRFDQWLRVKIGDAFWNNSRRRINKITVYPMSGQTIK